MDLTHHFTVPTSVDDTWAHFQDIASVGECFPGATVTEAEGDSFKGTVKVKLGPIALVYTGTGTFVEKDEAAHRFVVDAKGKDKRGNGTAGAKVTLSMAEGAGGGTDVEVVTDLAVTGKPAQFGRGVMQDVSDKLLGQFVACLEQRLGDIAPAATTAAAAPEPPADATAEPGTAAPAPPIEPPAAPPTEPASATATPDAAPAPAAAGAGTVGSSSQTPVDGGADRPAAAAAGAPPADTEAGRHAAPRPTPAAARPAPRPAQADDAINLGSTVLPILIKSYWKQGAVALAVLLVIIWLIVR